MVELIVALVIVGVVLWAINTLLPMDQKIKTVLNVVAIVCVLLYVLRSFGLWHGHMP